MSSSFEKLMSSLAPERAKALAQLAQENNIGPRDPLWTVLHMVIFTESWNQESLQILINAAEAKRQELEAYAERLKLALSNRAVTFDSEIRQSIASTLDELAVSTALEISRHTERAVARASQGGWRGRVSMMAVAVLTGILVSVSVPVASRWAEQEFGMSKSDVDAMKIGNRFLRQWAQWTPEQQGQVWYWMDFPPEKLPEGAVAPVAKVPDVTQGTTGRATSAVPRK